MRFRMWTELPKGAKEISPTMIPKRIPRQESFSKRWFWLMAAFLAVGLVGAAKAPGAESTAAGHWTAWAFMTDDAYSWGERIALILNVVVAIAGLVYAGTLVK